VGEAWVGREFVTTSEKSKARFGRSALAFA
jgi:hypothetical protein